MYSPHPCGVAVQRLWRFGFRASGSVLWLFRVLGLRFGLGVLGLMGFRGLKLLRRVWP